MTTTNNLYPERSVSNQIEQAETELHGLEELDNQEKAILFEFEAKLFEGIDLGNGRYLNLEIIDSYSNPNTELFLDFFVDTQKGKEYFINLARIKGITFRDLNNIPLGSISNFFTNNNLANVTSLDYANKLKKQSRDYFLSKTTPLIQKLLSSELETDERQELEAQVRQFTFISTPFDSIKLRHHITDLRALKQFYKNKKSDLLASQGNTKLNKAKAFVIDLYLQKINFKLADALAEDINAKDFKVQKRRSRGRKIDRFMQGATNSSDDNQAGKILEALNLANIQSEENTGSHTPLTLELADVAKQIASARSEQENIPSDLQVLFNTNFSSKLLNDIYTQAINVLVQNGILKKNSEWKVRTDISRSSMAVNGDLNELLIPEKDRSGEDVLLVGVHEFIHVLQNEFKNILSVNGKTLKILESGLARASLHMEAGAMYAQGIAQKKAKGTSKMPIATYAAAVTTRLNGGDFIDCVIAAIQSERVTEDDSEEISDIINRTLRVFRKGESTDLEKGFARTQPLVYAEQVAYSSALTSIQRNSQVNSINSLLIGQVNLRSLYGLDRIGLINTDQIPMSMHETVDLLYKTILEIMVEALGRV